MAKKKANAPAKPLSEASIDNALSASDDKECEAFRKAYAAYMAAEASAFQFGGSDKEMHKALNAVEEATWALIRRRAPLQWMVRLKLQVLQSLMDNGGDWADRRDFMMVSSIIVDIDRNGEAQS